MHAFAMHEKAFEGDLQLTVKASVLKSAVAAQNARRLTQ